MKRVLFVDDDTNVLSGLRRTMRVLREEWEMEFIDDPEVALNAFRHHPFDVVVADMKMPKLDGADLLTEIKRLRPESIRIILSGHSDPAMIMKSGFNSMVFSTISAKTLSKSCLLASKPYCE